MKYKVVLGQSHKKLEVESSMSLDEVLLMVANEYGDEWYGCAVSCPETKSFILIPCKSYYTGIEDDGTPNKYYDFPEERKSWTVYQWAIKMFSTNLYIDHNHCLHHYSYDEESFTPQSPFKEDKENV